MKPEKVPSHLLQFPVDDYLSCDPLSDESDISCRRVDIVKIKKPQICHFDLFDPKREHESHPTKTYMWVERALVEGKFQSNYVCLHHIGVAIDFSDGGDIDPCELSCAQARDWIKANVPTP